jgi:mono/diheme cytochrome c family protein
MNRLFTLAALLLTSATAFAQSGDATHGETVFDKWCLPCHGSAMNGTLPGTLSLALKYQGSLPAVLTERKDLAPEFIRTVVRKGLYGMPMSRKTEISDQDLEDIIAFLNKR